MMLPTHAIAGMAVALPVALAVPELGSVALVAGFVGGIVPDLDMYAGHRKTLHYPAYYSAIAAVTALVAVLVPTPVTVAVAFLLIGAALHSLTDVFGGGLELRPWEATSDRAVYDHYRDQWIRPRHWVRYDGAPEDLGVAIVLAVPLVATLGGTLELLVVASLVVAAGYTAVRRSLPVLAERLVEQVRRANRATAVLAYLPARYTEASDERTGPSRAEEQ